MLLFLAYIRSSARPIALLIISLPPSYLTVDVPILAVKFTLLSEKEMLIELKTFVENLTCDCYFITHHTISGKNLTGSDFLKRKDAIIASLENEIEHGDLDRMAAIRSRKKTL